MSECGPSLAGDEPPVVSDINVGAELKEGRIKIGLSDIDIAQELRIDLEQIHGLESNQYESLSSAVFVKGYVRNYARLVGLDPAPLITAIEKGGVQAPTLASLNDALYSSGGTHGKESAVPLSGILTGVGVVLGLALLGFVGERMYYLATDDTAGSELSLPTAQSTKTMDIPTVSVALGETEQLVITEKDVNHSQSTTSITARDSVALSASETPVEEEQVAVIPVEELTELIELPPVVSAQQNNVPIVVRNETADTSKDHSISVNMSTMTLHFSSDSWAEVYDAEQARLVSRIGKAGSTATVEGVPPFSLVLGFAPGVSVKYNGESVDLQSRTQGNVARLQIGKADLE